MGSKLYRHNPASTPQTIEQVSNTAGTGSADNVFGMTPIGGLLFFRASNSMGATKLWSFNLSTGETTQVTDVNGEASGDSVSNLTPIGTTRLAFSGNNSGDLELYIYDLTTGETVRAADVNDGASDLATPVAVIDGRVIFRAEDGSGAAYYAAD